MPFLRLFLIPSSRRQNRPPRQKGFTLLEVLAAVTILGLAYVAILQNYSSSLRNIVRLDNSRKQLFKEQLEFEAALTPPVAPPTGDDAGLLFAEGRIFAVAPRTSAAGSFTTLKLINAPRLEQGPLAELKKQMLQEQK